MMSRISWEKILTFTPLDLTKLLISAAIIVLVTKIQLVNDRLSALLIALPLTSLVAMVWMYQAGQSPQRLANHAESTFWFVLPTLPMFLMLPWMLRHGWGFWPALALNCLLTIVAFGATVFVLRRCGIDLLPK
jgi:phage terminase large subunit-like protein